MGLGSFHNSRNVSMMDSGLGLALVRGMEKVYVLSILFVDVDVNGDLEGMDTWCASLRAGLEKALHVVCVEVKNRRSRIIAGGANTFEEGMCMMSKFYEFGIFQLMCVCGGKEVRERESVCVFCDVSFFFSVCNRGSRERV